MGLYGMGALAFDIALAERAAQTELALETGEFSWLPLQKMARGLNGG
jgi:hypothetical protein